MRNAQLIDTLDQRLVLAHQDAEYVARVKRCLNRLGWEVYLAKFPFVRPFRSGDALEIMGRAVRARFFRIVPSRLLYLDNRKGFGHREELEVYP